MIQEGRCKRCKTTPAVLDGDICIGGCKSIEIDGGTQSDRRVVMDTESGVRVILSDDIHGTWQKWPGGGIDRLSRPWDLHYMIAKRVAQGWTVIEEEESSR